MEYKSQNGCVLSCPAPTNCTEMEKVVADSFFIWKQSSSDSNQSSSDYKSYVRPILDYAAPLWHSSITEYQSRQIESIQKRVSRNILGNCFIDYGQALDMLHLETLSDQRMNLCKHIIQTAFTSNLFVDWFPPPNTSHSMTLRSLRMVEDSHGLTKRFHNSPIPYSVWLLNGK